MSIVPYRYRIYGLAVETTRAIALADPAMFETPDIRVDWTTDPPPDLSWALLRPAESIPPNHPVAYVAEANGERLIKVRFYHDDRLFLIVNRAVNHAWIGYTPLVPEADLASIFVGPVLGTMLRLRGGVVLHASSVAVDGQAIAFVGQSRSGKSTHAAALVKRGMRALADDLGVITPSGSGFQVESGYSRLRVRAGTAELIEPEYKTRLDQVYSDSDSFYAPLGDGFHSGALPLAAIYLIEPGSGVTPLMAQQAIPRLGRNIYGNHVVGPDLRADEFHLLCRLASAVPIRRLGASRDIANLGAQCDAVLADLFR